MNHTLNTFEFSVYLTDVLSATKPILSPLPTTMRINAGQSTHHRIPKDVKIMGIVGYRDRRMMAHYLSLIHI